jgi:alpha-beta hydrolase superfamily lysophospholipase
VVHQEFLLKQGSGLAAAGYAVCGVDLPGHGRTQGKQGHTSCAEILDTIGLLMRETKGRCPGVPVFLYGHSMEERWSSGTP